MAGVLMLTGSGAESRAKGRNVNFVESDED